MSLWWSMALQASPAGTDIDTFDLARSQKSPLPTVLPGCGPGIADDTEVVVCGRNRNGYRLPLPVQHDPLSGAVRGEARSDMAALTPQGRCGIFAGERRCDKREAAQYGYGNGRDPVTVLARLGRKIVDPEAN